MLSLRVNHHNDSFVINDDTYSIQLFFMVDDEVQEHSVIRLKELFDLMQSRARHIDNQLEQAHQLDMKTFDRNFPPFSTNLRGISENELPNNNKD